ncbi:MAG: glycosyltransferase family 2 protein [Hyphomicrobiaceae bacterium]|nr:MAG: glycosyltransferase family 2 protein [Hyphomicrobiaceae bacterium]
MVRQRISLVIPVLNEEQNLPALKTRLAPVLNALDVEWDVLFVDDGSLDGTVAAIRTFHSEDNRFRGISFSRNFGKECAIAAGLRYATGDAVVLMDADLQHPPETIAAFLARWREGNEVVYGQRTDRAHDGPVRRLLANLFYGVFKAMSRTPLPRGAGDFRLLDRRAVDVLNKLGERARYNNGLYSWIGFRSAGVPYDVAAREGGAPKWRWRRLFGFALDGLMSFSTVPLRMSSVLGLCISLAALAYAIVFFVKTLILGIDVPGFPTLVISIMVLSGVQLISLGVLGEYLGRIYEEVKGRPLFIVAEEIGIDAAHRPANAERIAEQAR